MWLACIIWLLLPNYILMQEFQLCSWIGIQHQKLNIGIEDILTSWSTIYFAAWLYDQSLDGSTSKDRSCFGIYLFNKEFSVLNTSFFQLDMLLLHIIVRPRELKKWCLRFMICDFMICSHVFGHLFTFEVCSELIVFMEICYMSLHCLQFSVLCMKFAINVWTTVFGET